MNKYDPYFLPHILYIQDHFCKYYVQRPGWCPQEILDVPCTIFVHVEDVQNWLPQCLEYDAYETMNRLRVFLAEDCTEQFLVPRMDDQQVITATAVHLVMHTSRIVIEPKHGWALRINHNSAQPEIPFGVQAAPDTEALFEQIKQELDALVAEQQKKHDQYEAALATMIKSKKRPCTAKRPAAACTKGPSAASWIWPKPFPAFMPGI